MYFILIVDDEYLIRKGLRYAIPWESIGFMAAHEAASAEEALVLLANTHIDVAIIDINMPGMNGLELISNIKEQFPHIKTVIISGHNDFNYSVKALKMEVSDYILKPIDKTEIISSFTKLKRRMDEEHKLQGIIEARGHASGKLLIKYLLNNDFVNQDELNEYCIKYGIDFTSEKYCVIVVKIKDLVALIRDRFNLSRPRFEEAMDNILSYAGSSLGIINKNILSSMVGDNYVILTSASDGEELSEKISDKLRSLTPYFQIGLSEGSSKLNYLNVSFLQAVEAITNNGVMGGISRFKLRENKKELDISSKIYFSKMIIQKLDEGKFNEIDAIIDMIFNEFQSNDINEIFNWCVNSIYSLIDYFNINSFSNRKVISDFDILAITSNFSIAAVKIAYKEKLDKIVELLNSIQSGSVEQIVSKVCDIANKEYKNPELSLQELAPRLNISYGYLSTAFKQIKGENFSTYLTNVKMNQARKLILEGQHKINEIAELVGYSSARYFTDQFRKHFGTSPSDYKTRLGKK